jgi:hypothetical protein
MGNGYILLEPYRFRAIIAFSAIVAKVCCFWFADSEFIVLFGVRKLPHISIGVLLLNKRDETVSGMCQYLSEAEYSPEMHSRVIIIIWLRFRNPHGFHFWKTSDCDWSTLNRRSTLRRL